MKVETAIKKILLSTVFSFVLTFVYAQLQTDTLNIFFDFDKSVINDDNAKLINDSIIDKDIVSISIHGYADFIGSATYNQQLSERRSASVFNYLLSNGIDRENILISKGDGIHPNSAKENRQDLADKGIKAHRMVQIIYTVKAEMVENVKTMVNENLIEENFVVDSTIVLENVFFYFQKYVFHPESYPALVEFLEIMQKYHTLKIEIQGHADTGVNYTEEIYINGEPLSLNRAKAVYDYLVERGIDASRMKYKGYGGTRPISSEGWKNRRVEILILEK